LTHFYEHRSQLQIVKLFLDNSQFTSIKVLSTFFQMNEPSVYSFVCR